MAHPDYIAAAKQSNRTPTVFMKVESADGETLYYTTQGDWQGSDTLTNIDTTEEPGSVTQERTNTITTMPKIEGSAQSVQHSATMPYTGFINSGNNSFSWSTAAGDPVGSGPSALFRLRLRDDLTTPTIDFYSEEITVNRVPVTLYSEVVEVPVRDTTQFTSGATVFITCEVFVGGGWVVGRFYNVKAHSFNTVYPTSQLKTSAIDFGAVITTNPVFSADDVTESGALIAYSYEYSDAGSVYTPGGSIVDGDSLVASRFYKITSDFTTTTGGRGKIREIQLEEGLFLYFGTHIDEPFSGVSPQLTKAPVSTFNQKITISKGLSTTGQSTVKMFWVPETSDLIASGYLRGQDVSIYSGFKGLSTEAYEPVIVGTWFDHSLDEVAGEITVKIQDALKQFEKRKIPEEEIDNTDGSIDTTPIIYSATSLVTVMKDVFDQIGLRDRYISPDFDTLEAGDYAAAKYKVSRTLSKPTAANKLLDELAQTGSMFLIPLGNGQIKPKPFDINQEHSATLDADFIDFVNLEGNLDSMFTRFYSYYNPSVADPSNDRDDYDNGVALLDTNAELRWFPEKGIKEHFDKWKVGRSAPSTPLTVPPQALIDKNVLDNALLTEPLYTVSAKKLGPKFADIEPADVVQVNNLRLPVVDNDWTDESPFYTGKDVSLTPQGIVPQSIYISQDGLKLFVLVLATADVYQYTMSTAWDISTATYDTVNFSVSGQDTQPAGVTFKTDGLSMYITGVSSDFIYQYTLTTAWDLNTASYASKSVDTSPEDSTMRAIDFSSTGDQLYTTGSGNGKMYQYTLTTPWDISTASYSSNSVSVTSEDANPNGLSITQDGSRCFMTGPTDKVYQYNLATKFDISTATYDNVFVDVSGQNTFTQDINLSNDGLSMFVAGNIPSSVFEYELINSSNFNQTQYTEGDRVIHDGKMWRARQDSTGKDPISEAAFWQDTAITDEGYTNGKHFFVLGRKFNPNTALIDLDLMEMPPGTIGGFSDGFSSGFNV